jgi:Arc/MetJ-type ribon-helix-helix transcriptional regulator
MMDTTIRLTPHSQELLEEQLAHGLFRSPEEVIERALETLAQKESGHFRRGPSHKTPAEAVADILKSRSVIG